MMKASPRCLHPRCLYQSSLCNEEETVVSVSLFLFLNCVQSYQVKGQSLPKLLDTATINTPDKEAGILFYLFAAAACHGRPETDRTCNESGCGEGRRPRMRPSLGRPCGE